MSPRKPDPEYTFDHRGLPTLAVKWDQVTLPEKPVFPATATGRRARGELEALVDYVVKEHTTERRAVECTAEYIARRVAELDEGRVCSSGAVWRILETWQQIGYAEYAHRPRRFLYFTVDGIAKGLPELHRQARRKKIRERGAVTRQGYRDKGW